MAPGWKIAVALDNDFCRTLWLQTEHISLMKMRSLARLSVCSNQIGFSLPDSMASATFY